MYFFVLIYDARSYKWGTQINGKAKALCYDDIFYRYTEGLFTTYLGQLFIWETTVKTEKSLNHYQKLSKARYLLLKEDLKKTGFNKFSNYYYFKLEDFLPAALRILHEVGLCSVINIPPGDTCSLKIYDSEDPTLPPIEFIASTSAANMKGAQDIQNLGATHSYLRRYLWFMAFEICEDDEVDLQDNSKAKNAPSKPNGEMFKDNLGGSKAVASASGGFKESVSHIAAGHKENQPGLQNTTNSYEIPLGNLKGKKLFDLSDEQLQALKTDVTVFLQANPNHKDVTTFGQLVLEIKKEMIKRGL